MIRIDSTVEYGSHSVPQRIPPELLAITPADCRDLFAPGIRSEQIAAGSISRLTEPTIAPGSRAPAPRRRGSRLRACDGARRRSRRRTAPDRRCSCPPPRKFTGIPCSEHTRQHGLHVGGVAGANDGARDRSVRACVRRVCDEVDRACAHLPAPTARSSCVRSADGVPCATQAGARSADGGPGGRPIRLTFGANAPAIRSGPSRRDVDLHERRPAPPIWARSASRSASRESTVCDSMP